MDGIAIITGASSGLGREFISLLKTEKYREIWAIARRQDKLEELQNMTEIPIRLFSLDLSKEASIGRLEQQLSKEKPRISLLINGAGFAKIGSYREVSRGDIDQMVAVNCRAAMDMCHICLPYMKKGDRIINICSTAGFQPFPFLSVYSASKAFLYRYSKALRWELFPRGISVTAVCPYWIKDTEFIEKAKETEQRKRIVGFPLASRRKNVARWALFDAGLRLPVSTPGPVCFVHRIVAKFIPSEIMMGIWELIRRI